MGLRGSVWSNLLAVGLAAGCSTQLDSPEGRAVGAAAPLAGDPCATNLDCAMPDPCVSSICDPIELVCVSAFTNAGCNDNNACTSGDVCGEGTCVGGNRAAGCTACQAIATLPTDGGQFVGVVQGTDSLRGTCDSAGGSPERVYAWTAPRSGAATFQTCGGSTNFDTVLYLRSGCSSGSQLACNDDAINCPVADGLPNSGQHGSRLAATVTAGTTYYIVVDGWGGRQGAYTLSVFPPSMCGNNVREALEECDGTDVSMCVSGTCEAGCTCTLPGGGLPDLVPAISEVRVVFDTTVPQADLAEGCASAASGIDLLRFTTGSSNLGTADLYFGDPRCPDCANHPGEVCADPRFECAPANGHGHAHYDNYATYDLLDASSGVVASGHKQGFCMRDNACPAGTNPKYTCTNQGITAGCNDIYDASLGCQYIDITSVPSGQYTLRVRLDPFGLIPEVSETNNEALAPVVISRPPADGGVPPQVGLIPPEGGSFPGATGGSSAESASCAAQATAGAPEHSFLWTPSDTGTAVLTTCSTATTFDTVLSVNASGIAGTELACNDDTSGCGVSDGSSGSSRHGSRISLPVTAGQSYYITVDGYSGSSGRSEGQFVLTVSPPPPSGTPDAGTGDSGSDDSGSSDAGAPQAVALPPEGGAFPGTTSGASLYAGACASGPTSGAPENVYSWTPSTSGTAVVETCSTQGTFDTVLYARASLAGASLACNDDTAGCGVNDGSPNASRHGSRLSLGVTAGLTYYLFVDGYQGSPGGAQGQYVLTVTPP